MRPSNEVATRPSLGTQGSFWQATVHPRLLARSYTSIADIRSWGCEIKFWVLSFGFWVLGFESVVEGACLATCRPRKTQNSKLKTQNSTCHGSLLRTSLASWFGRSVA